MLLFLHVEKDHSSLHEALTSSIDAELRKEAINDKMDIVESNCRIASRLQDSRLQMGS